MVDCNRVGMLSPFVEKCRFLFDFLLAPNRDVGLSFRKNCWRHNGQFEKTGERELHHESKIFSPACACSNKMTCEISNDETLQSEKYDTQS